MSYAQQPPQHGSDRPNRAAYERAAATVRERAHNGEPCWFWGRDPYCPDPHFDWQLPSNHRLAYTTHHLDRLMDGGDPAPDPACMVPAHRGCNARDGLNAQNARRRGQPTTTPTTTPTERTSRNW